MGWRNDPTVKALVRRATGKRLTNRLPKLSLITLPPPLNSGIIRLRMGLYVPTPMFFYNLWGPSESELSNNKTSVINGEFFFRPSKAVP